MKYFLENKSIQVLSKHCGAILLFLSFSSDATKAQSLITPDATLGSERTQIIESFEGLPVEVIFGGAQREKNLFHSFHDFNISASRGAYFFSPDVSIQNIFARITGENRSEILGTLGTFGEGNPNLFLINPNGIIFGSSSSLVVTGSFLATTADVIEFGENGIFSTSEPLVSNLLTVNPSALFFNSLNTHEIVNQSVSNQTVLGSPANGLNVPSGRSLTLVGGDIRFDGGRISVNDGHVEIAGIKQDGVIGLRFNDHQIRLLIPETSILSNIYINQGGSIMNSDSSIGIQGDIQIYGNEVILSDSSSLTTNSQAQKGGDIYVNARDLILQNSSSINTTAAFQGDAGDIHLQVMDNVLITNGSNVGSIAINPLLDFPASAGNIYLRTRSLNIQSSPSLNSGIASFTFLSSGNVGNIDIEAEEIRLERGGILSNSLGAGRSGDIDIEVGSLEILGGTIASNTFNPLSLNNVPLNASFILDPNLFSQVLLILNSLSSEEVALLGQSDSGNISLNARYSITLSEASQVLSTTGGQGEAGTIQIGARNLLLEEGSLIRASTFGEGNASNVVIRVTETIRLDGVNPIIGRINPTTISSSAEIGSRGNAGSIQVFSDNLEVTNGAQINAFTAGEGIGGSVFLDIEETAYFDGVSPTNGFPTAVISAVAGSGESKGGNIEISAMNLEVTNGAILTASTYGVGDAGNVILTIGETARFDGVNPLTSLSTSGVRSAVEPFGVGMGGNVEISATNLEITNGAQIITSTFENGNAGNIEITVRNRATLQGTSSWGIPSGVFADNTQLSTGQGNNIQITAPQLFVQDGAVIFATTNNAQPGGDIIFNLGRLEVLRGGQVVTSTLGTGPAGTIQINATDGIRVAGSDPNFANRLEILPGTASFATPQSLISVQSSGAGTAGNIIIGDLGTTPWLELSDGGRIIAESASVDGGNVVITLNELLLLRNGGLISTTAGTAQAGGNGGNIAITAPFIVAIREENSDIAADAFAGAGGNVTINARGIFGIEPRPQRTPFSDITASSELGLSGVVTLNTLDTSSIENSLASLDDTFIDTAALTAGSCIARTNESLGSFTVTGRGGLPQRPGDRTISAYPTGTVRALPETTALQEPDGVYQLPDGRLVLSRACE